MEKIKRFCNSPRGLTIAAIGWAANALGFAYYAHREQLWADGVWQSAGLLIVLGGMVVLAGYCAIMAIMGGVEVNGDE